MKFSYLLFAFLLLGYQGKGQSPVKVVRDIDYTSSYYTYLSSWSNPKFLASSRNALFFSANSTESGQELWKSNGTMEHTVQVKDIRPGPDSSDPANLTDVNGVLYFSADDGEHGSELYKSDGTDLGTVFVKDIRTGATGGAITSPYNGNGTLFFAANDGSTGSELWKSDGTEPGTVLLKDISPGVESSNPTQFIWAGDRVLFQAYDGTHGNELWKSDGTEAGTQLVKDIYPGPGSSNISSMIRLGSVIYFIAIDETHGYELWRSDGTEAGTFMVKDITTGSASSNLQGLTSLNGNVFFSTEAGCWKSDGTDQGTKPFSGGCGTTAGNFMYHTTYVIENPGSNSPLAAITVWRGDGTETGDFAVGTFSESAPHESTRKFTLGDRTLVVVSHQDLGGATAFRLWKCDDLGPAVIKGFEYGGGYYSPAITNLTFVDNQLFFTIQDPKYLTLWRSDGTTAGTIQLTPSAAGTLSAHIEPNSLDQNDQVILFSASHLSYADHLDLWRSYGYEAGTSFVKNVGITYDGRIPHVFQRVGSTFFFSASDGVNGDELWKTDGTTNNTQLVKDITAGPSSSVIRYKVDFNGTLFFANDYDLWKSDGTPAGTLLVKQAAVYGPDFVVAGSNLFFAGYDGTNLGLARTDGTSQGTTFLKEIQYYNPPLLPEKAALNGILYIVGYQAGYELWRSDGTPAGTIKITDLQRDGGFQEYGSAPLPFSLTSSNGLLFFNQCDGNGCELWKSDGTEAGTVMVKDINSAAGKSSHPFNLTDVNGELLFNCYSAEDGLTLWKSNGTESGTILVKKFSDSFQTIDHATSLDGGLYFFLNNAIWYSNGTSCGTVMATQAMDGLRSPIYKLGNRLFFVTYTEDFDIELYYADVGWLFLSTDPAITEYPSDVQACLGSTLDLSVRATGSGLTYEWKKGQTLLGTGSHLHLTNLTGIDAGSYSVQVTGDCGVAAPPSITISVDAASTASAWYIDSDADGLGSSYQSIVACSAPVGFVGNHSDCDDSDPSVTTPIPLYPDKDGDGFGIGNQVLTGCFILPGYSKNNLDPDDTNSKIYGVTGLGADGDLAGRILVWPIPAQDYFEIDLGEAWDKESTRFKIISTDGNGQGLIIQRRENNIVGIKADLASGLYLLIIQDQSHTVRKKVIVTR